MIPDPVSSRMLADADLVTELRGQQRRLDDLLSGQQAIEREVRGLKQMLSDALPSGHNSFSNVRTLNIAEPEVPADATHQRRSDVLAASSSIPSDKVLSLCSSESEQEKNLEGCLQTLAFELKPRDRNSQIGRGSKHIGASMRAVSVRRVEAQMMSPHHVADGLTFCFWAPRLPLQPDSLSRVVVDAISMVLLFYDSLMVPYTLAWDTSLKMPLEGIAWFALFFWTAQIGLGFTSCFTEHGVTVHDWSRIAHNYLRTWFLLDLTTVAIDWSGVVVQGQAQAHNSMAYFKFFRMLKVVRLIRVVAMIRLARFARTYTMLLHFASQVGSLATAQFTVKIAKLVFLILWLSHIGGCLWFGLVKVTSRFSDTGFSWQATLSSNYNVDNFSADMPNTFLYLIAFYSSAATMFSGASFFAPSNSLEACFDVVFLVFGVLFASSMISSISSMLVDYEMMQRDRNKELSLLRQFLTQHRVEPLLFVNIKTQVMHRMSIQKRLSYADIPVLSLLSVDLRSALKHSLFAPPLTEHAFIRCLDYLDDSFLRQLCHLALAQIVANPGDEVVASATAVDNAYLLKYGAMRYAPGASHDSFVDVHIDQWICEVALWIAWSARGCLEAISFCELLSVSAVGLNAVLGAHPDVEAVVCDLSITMCSFIAKERANVGDLALEDVVDYDTVISLMPYTSRLLVSKPAVKGVRSFLMQSPNGPLLNRSTVNRSLGLGPRQNLQIIISKLDKELREGECNLRQDASGNVMRVVQVVALHFEREDGRVCVELGKWEQEDAPVAVLLPPGAKLQQGEYPLEALRRMLAHKLHPFASALQVTERKIVRKLRPSYRYGIATTYVRTVFVASLQTGVYVDGLSKYICRPQVEPLDCMHQHELEIFTVDDRDPALGHSSDSCVGGVVYAWLRPDELDALTALGEAGKAFVASYLDEWSKLREKGRDRTEL